MALNHNALSPFRASAAESDTGHALLDAVGLLMTAMAHHVFPGGPPSMRVDVSSLTGMEGPPLNSEQSSRSLWIGDLPGWIDEGFLYNLFVGTNQLASVKLIRNRTTALSEGYAFLEFRAHEAAATILKSFNGSLIPGTDVVFRLNWAAYGVGKASPTGEGRALHVLACQCKEKGPSSPHNTTLIIKDCLLQTTPSLLATSPLTFLTRFCSSTLASSTHPCAAPR